jgi:serine/threonine protein phosphatase 1
LIDRGDKNKEVVQLIMEDWFFTVRGNHDQMILDQFEDERILLFGDYANKTPQQVHSDLDGLWFSDLPITEQQWFSRQLLNLPYIIEVETEQGTVVITHAGVPVDYKYYQYFIKNLGDRNVRELCLRSRRPNKIDRNLPDITMTIHGHTCFSNCYFRGNSVWIDTFGESGQLTVIKITNLLNRLR